MADLGNLSAKVEKLETHVTRLSITAGIAVGLIVILTGGGTWLYNYTNGVISDVKSIAGSAAEFGNKIKTIRKEEEEIFKNKFEAKEQELKGMFSSNKKIFVNGECFKPQSIVGCRDGDGHLTLKLGVSCGIGYGVESESTVLAKC